MPLPFARACRSDKTGRMAGRRISDRSARVFDYGNIYEAEPDAVPEPAGHGDRRNAAQFAGRRRGTDGRMRQDDAGITDGRNQHGYSGDLFSGGADAARQLEWRATGKRNGRVEVLDGAVRGNDWR